MLDAIIFLLELATHGPRRVEAQAHIDAIAAEVKRHEDMTTPPAKQNEGEI